MEEELYQKLLNSGFRFVSYRPRSEKEIRDFLERKLKRFKTFAPQVVKKVTERLRELGYINDSRFMNWWVEQRTLHRPKGERLIKRELLAKGIGKDELAENFPKISEKELAIKAVSKKLLLWKKLPDLERKKKIYAFLGRRGFSAETIERIIDEIGHFGVK